MTKRGLPPKKAGTASSMMLWLFTKLRLDSGKVAESSEHRPGLGFGSLILGTGNQLELAVSCSLKAPSKVSMRSLILNAQMALPPMEFLGVVKTA